ncbi:helix-turn-helix domain-containing protein [Wenyingzhuangia sp. IMCC45533]
MNNSEELKLLMMFSLLASINLMVLFLILFFKKNNTLCTKVLGLLVFVPSAVLIVNPLLYSKGFSDYLLFIYLAFSIPFLFGPLLLLYIHLVQGNSYRFKRKYLLHFLPVFAVTLYGFYIHFQPDEFIRENYLQIVSGENLVTNLIYFAQFIHFAVYITWSIRKVNSFKTKTYMSVTDRNNYNWLKFFVTRLLYLNILLMVVYVVQMSFFPNYMMYSDLLATPLASTCFYPIMVYKSFTSDVFSKEVLEKQALKSRRSQTLASNNIANKEISLGNNGDASKISKSILKEVKDNKSYLRPDYTIFDLSKQLQLSQRTISETINSEMGKNFSDLINEHRVEESKLILIDKSKDLTIDAIAELSGFKSRATFYRVFKDKTKMTPLQYIKTHKVVS